MSFGFARFLLLIIAASVFTEGCHYGFSKKRKKRSLETEITESDNLRTFFTTCLGNELSGWDFQTLTDVTVLDSAWYDETSMTVCQEYTENDNALCWKNAIAGYYLSEPELLQAAQTCIDMYFEDYEETMPGKRKKRQANNLLGGSSQRIFGVWSRWTSWSSCTKSCNTGQQTRTRRCIGIRCSGSSRETRRCSTRRCPSRGRWSPWSRWSSCSRTCGQGTQIRRRTCRPRGASCRGTSFQTRNCTLSACPPGGYWSSWRSWSPCSRTCGFGRRSRLRFCIGVSCTGSSTQTQRCRLRDCPSNGWRNWSSWSRCSRTCGNGIQVRTRTCRLRVCQGRSRQTRRCNIRSCGGKWAPWGSWSSCSRTCNGGYSLRYRRCIGRNCPGSNRQSRPCATRDCLGSWGRWSVWSRCSRTCNIGVQTRTRRCRPTGSHCRGRAAQIRTCGKISCFSNQNGPFFSPRRLEIPRCVRSSSRSILPRSRARLDYNSLNRFVATNVRCRLWTSLRIVQYNNAFQSARRIRPARGFSGASSVKEISDLGFSVDRIRVPTLQLINATNYISNLRLPSYLLNADLRLPISPVLLNINPRLPVPPSTECLASLTKSYSPLRAAVEVCAQSYSFANRRRNGK